MKYKPHFDFDYCLAALEGEGKRRFGHKFQIHDTDHEVIYRLLSYFLRSSQDADQLNMDLEKGIVLSGPVGCGKSTLMMLMSKIPGPMPSFIMRTCRDITWEFADEGFAVINRYSVESYRNYLPKTYCFDDLGAEQGIKHFGNQCNVMGEILLSRYDHFVTNRMITHLTTNLSASQLEELYGNRVRSRLREQFNLLAFVDSSDKR